jgi:hypothetical protein
MFKAAKYFCISLALVLSANAAAPYQGRLGVEAVDDAFVNIACEGCRWTNSDGTKLTDVDASGWPRTDCRWVMDRRPCAEWIGPIDDPERYRIDCSGTYKGSFLGKAIVTAAGGPCTVTNVSYNTANNLTTFDLTLPKPGPNVGLVILQFTDTRRSPGDPADSGIRNLRLIRPGYAADTTQLFTNEYHHCLESAAFSTIRFMGVLATNDNIEWNGTRTGSQSWSSRKLPTDASVDPIEPLNKKDGWPWEYAVELCNETNMDMWINIPISANDDYIRQLATLLKSSLKPGLHIYIEDSNEVWNFGFLQYSWNKARAVEEVKAGSAPYNYDNVNQPEIWGQRRHAQRVRDDVAIFASVFGAAEVNHRIRGILAGCTPDPQGFFIGGRLPGMLEYLRATGGDPAKDIYAISMAIYYGGKAASAAQGTEHDTVDQVLEDMRADAERSVKDRRAMVALARQYRLPGGFCAYESGPALGIGSTTNLANRIEAIRDPRQADIYRENFASCFWDLGGNLAMQFALEGAYTRYGAWGLTDDLSNPDRNSLFGAVRQLIGTQP